MTKNLHRTIKALSLAILCSTIGIPNADARSGLAPARATGAPGSGSTCVTCHGGSGSGNINVSFSGNTEYTPGQMYTLMVTVTDPGKQRFGFSMVARDTDNDTVDVGTLAANGPNTQVYSGGTHVGHVNAPFAPDTFTFTVDWTAPATGVGDVTFYVSANGANGTGGTGGDSGYLTTFTITEPAPPSEPPVLSDLVFLENGSAQLTLTGTAGQTYTVEHSANLIAWELLEMTTLAAATATATITDTGAPGNSPRFYRATQNAP